MHLTANKCLTLRFSPFADCLLWTRPWGIFCVICFVNHLLNRFCNVIFASQPSPCVRLLFVLFATAAVTSFVPCSLMRNIVELLVMDELIIFDLCVVVILRSRFASSEVLFFR